MAKKMARETEGKRLLKKKLDNTTDPTLHGKKSKKEIPNTRIAPREERYRGVGPFHRIIN